jgi:hypothetical protein
MLGRRKETPRRIGANAEDPNWPPATLIAAISPAIVLAIHPLSVLEMP